MINGFDESIGRECLEKNSSEERMLNANGDEIVDDTN